MGSWILGIPRRRTRQLGRVAEELVDSYLSRSYLLRLKEGKGLPILLDRVLVRDGEEAGNEERRRRRIGSSSSSSSSSSERRRMEDEDGRRLLVPFAAMGGEETRVSTGSSLMYLGKGFQERRWMATYSRINEEAARVVANAATTAVVYDEEEDDVKMKNSKEKEKEVSPEDCDQAVEGLSSAKAKAKQAQETLKQSYGWIIKIRNAFFGIGPALQAVAAMSRQDWANKIAGWGRSFWVELQHYWAGTKLLWADVKISSRLLLKLASGKSLSRRQRQQLTRTTADIFRLVPFAVFILVPFMEFLLPFAIRLFPNMLPSTFQDKMKEEEKLKKRLNARIQYAKFLQDTVGEMAKELKTSKSSELHRTADDLDDFMQKVRTGGKVQNDDILSFAKLFNDELTLDNISRPRLLSMCKYMNIQPYGTDAYLRYSLRTKLSWIKQDDRMIQNEGLDTLSESELRSACRERGMLGMRSVEEMRQQLRDWLDLSLNHSVPSSLLILSRAFLVAGRTKPEEVVQATLSSLPDEVIDSVGVTALGSEDSLSEHRRKLEFLQQQEELIKQEEKEEQVEEKEKSTTVADGSDEKDHALREMMLATAREAQQLAQSKTLHKRDELCKLSGALAVLASASSVSKERGEFLRLVKNEIQLYNSMIEKEGTDDAEEARNAFYHSSREAIKHYEERLPADHVSSALIERVDAMLHKLEKELDDVDIKIGDRWRILDRDYDGKVTAEEVAAAAMFLKDSLDKASVHELISKLAKDPGQLEKDTVFEDCLTDDVYWINLVVIDGKILVEDIVKLGTTAEGVEGDHDDISQPQQKQQQTAI